MSDRRHQWRLRRMGYQFPAAKKIIHEGEGTSLLTGWIVPILHDPVRRLYGVVRYSPHGDDVAWVESESHFGADEAAAEAWIRQTFEELRKEGEDNQE